MRLLHPFPSAISELLFQSLDRTRAIEELSVTLSRPVAKYRHSTTLRRIYEVSNCRLISGFGADNGPASSLHQW